MEEVVFNTYEIVIKLKKKYNRVKLYDDVYKHIHEDDELDVVFDNCTMDEIYIDSLVRLEAKAKDKALEKARVIAEKLKKLGYEVDDVKLTWVDSDFINELIERIGNLEEEVYEFKKKVEVMRNNVAKRVDEMLKLLEKLKKTTRSKKAKAIIDAMELKLESMKWSVKW